jgi:2-polyprenyl-3-methyl-5-hydroxy-6-metoxy-1,4-benzoquinol methylase
MMHKVLQSIGFLPLIWQSDPGVRDRFIWLKKNLRTGAQRTMDAGSGSGTFAIYAATTGNHVLGISFDVPKNQKARARAKRFGVTTTEFREGDLRKLDSVVKHDKQFDQIICFETIEHILNDSRLLKDFSKSLVPNGRLLLTTPFKHYKKMPGEGISDVEDGGHVRWGYTHEELSVLAEKRGLHIIKKEYLSGIITQGLIRLERRLKRYHVPAKIARIIVLPFRIFQIIDRPLTTLLRFPYLSVAIVAQKQ